jgi:dTDP-4-dehydrorhamnose reductase
MTKKRILIFGVTGMLGHTLFKSMSRNPNFDVFGTTRNKSGLSRFFSSEELRRIRDQIDADNFDTVLRAFASNNPDIIINCIGLIKQLPMSSDPLTTITANAQLPHRMSLAARTAGARMIHISTDCVFSGTKGNYTESDVSDATDLYGRTKYLGEVEYPHCVTLRTSIIGHELRTDLSLVDWFLNQTGTVKGFTKAIYTGFPTVEMERIITNHVIPNEDLRGTYHVSSAPISKYDLLSLVKSAYRKRIDIEKFDNFVLDRSLDSSKFQLATGYKPPSWDAMVEEMYADFMKEDCYTNNAHRKAIEAGVA